MFVCVRVFVGGCFCVDRCVRGMGGCVWMCWLFHLFTNKPHHCLYGVHHFSLTLKDVHLPLLACSSVRTQQKTTA